MSVLIPDLRPVESSEYPDVHLAGYLVGRVQIIDLARLGDPRDKWDASHVVGRVSLLGGVLLINVSDDGRTEVAASAVLAAVDAARRALRSMGDPFIVARETLAACGVLVEQ